MTSPRPSASGDQPGGGHAPGPFCGIPDVGSLPSCGIEEPPVEPTAPDGVPWRKACGECMYRDKSVIPHLEADCAEAGAAFYCVHRTDGEGYFRVCAGFAARAAHPAPPAQETTR